MENWKLLLSTNSSQSKKFFYTALEPQLIDSLLRKIQKTYTMFTESKWIIKKTPQLKGDLQPKNTLIKVN